MGSNLNFTPGGPEQLNMGQGQQTLNVDINTLSNFRCRCGNQVFQPLFIAKKVSALQSPNGKDGVAPMQIFACTQCGAVPIEFGGQLLEQDTKDENPPDGHDDGK